MILDIEYFIQIYLCTKFYSTFFLYHTKTFIFLVKLNFLTGRYFLLNKVGTDNLGISFIDNLI